MLNRRTLTVHSEAIPQVGGQPALEPVRLSGREGINGLFCYELILKTPDALSLDALSLDARRAARSGARLDSSGAANWSLDHFLGREISCAIALDGQGRFAPGAVGASVDHIGQGERQINALITDAQLWGQEGRHAQYKLTLRPWLHLATLTADCKIFQNQTVVQTLDALLADYPFPVDKRLSHSSQSGPSSSADSAYAVRDYQCQFNETDHQFFERLCQEHGISYFFEHSQGKHRLVLVDSMGAYQKSPSAAYQGVEYHPPGSPLDAEYISRFVPHHQLTSGQYTSRDYDYSRPRADLTASAQDARPASLGIAQGQAEVYQWHAPEGGSHCAQPGAGSAQTNETNDLNDPHAQGRHFALLRLQALRSPGVRARASGNLRGMVPGCSFALQKHPQHGANTDWLVLDSELLIEDIDQASQASQNSSNNSKNSQNTGTGLQRTQQWRVQVDFTVHPMREMLRPALTQTKPHTGGPQAARVVGPAAENIWTDHLGRIKVQFPWDRLGQHNQHSTCWVRVASAWAGNQLGAMHVPRIGQEVLIDFLGGDADLPICTGRVNNQANQPPWALPGQSALSGFRSRELTAQGGNSAAGRSNHLILDDTERSIQAQLKSDHQSSSLSLGHITRIEDHGGRKDARGEGFELRSDGHGVLRASEGLLITTEARSQALGHAKAMEETTAWLQAAQTQHAALAHAASTAKAQQGEQNGPGQHDQADVAQALQAQHDAISGKTSASNKASAQSALPQAAIHSGVVKSGLADASTGTSTSTDTQDAAFPELSAPCLVLASRAGMAATTAGTAHLQAGAHAALTSQGHTSLSAAKRWLVSAKDGLRLFARKRGIRLMAGNQRVQIEAHKARINLAARQAVRITSTEGEIHLSASKIVINGGGSFTEWTSAGITHGTRGTWVEHAAGHAQLGPLSLPLVVQHAAACASQTRQAAADGAGSVSR